MCALSQEDWTERDALEVSPALQRLGPDSRNGCGLPRRTGGVEPQVWIKETLSNLILNKPEGVRRLYGMRCTILARLGSGGTERTETTTDRGNGFGFTLTDTGGNTSTKHT